MVAYFVHEDGPLVGSVLALDEGEEWVLGRDPKVAAIVLEDPMASRKHALLSRRGDNYYLENVSKVNPLEVNGEPLEEEVLLHEGDSIQIGNSILRFTEKKPRAKRPKKKSKEKKSEETPEEVAQEALEEDNLERDEIYEPVSIEAEPVTPSSEFLPFLMDRDTRWLLKVVSGPNQGAEFGMNLGESYIIGKDPHTADIIFQDLSVSKQHAKLTLSLENEVTIEDLGSRNSTLVNGFKIEGVQAVQTQDIISTGTTSFLLLDREASEETIYAPTHPPLREEGVLSDAQQKKIEDETPISWRETFIPTKHLILASVFSLLITVGLMSLLALFRSQTVVVHNHDERSEIHKVLEPFKGVQFSYSMNTGTLFLTGHLLTNLEHSEVLHLLGNLPFLIRVEDNIIINEGVWESMNALLSQNPNWRTVMITSLQPGRFVLRGFLPTEEDAAALQAYINLNFPYLNLLDNQVVVEDTLHTQIQNLLIEKGFVNVSFNLNGGEVILAGRVQESEEKKFRALLETIGDINGVRQIKNFVIFTTASTARIDLTSQYRVTGNTKLGTTSLYVVINGKILSQGDLLDGMVITAITSKEVSLEKDGIKYKIDYNQQ